MIFYFLPLLGVNHCQILLNMPKILVYNYTTEKCINQFVIGYMINPTLHVRRVPSQEVPFFYTQYHLSELKSCKSIISAGFPFIFIYK